MAQNSPAKAFSRRFVLSCLVIVALLAAAIALLFALSSLKRAEAKNAELAAWQSAVLTQLESASSSADSMNGDRLTAAEGAEALADLIASRNTALQILSVPVPYAVDAPRRLPDDLRPAKEPRKGSSNTIPNLLNRESTGTAVDDVVAVERDSQAPWAGWK